MTISKIKFYTMYKDISILYKKGYFEPNAPIWSLLEEEFSLSLWDWNPSRIR